MSFACTTKINPSPYYNAQCNTVHGMEYVRLGSTGAVVSRICLGLMSYAHMKPEQQFPSDRKWTLNQEEGEPFIKQALDAGITFFDTAEIYADGRSEEFFGIALKKLLPQSRFKREDLFIASKVHPARTVQSEGGISGLQKGLSRKAICAAVEGSLERLQLEYLDLYLIHRFDPSTSMEETMKALHDLVQSGRVRYIGASSMYTWQFARMQEVAERNGWTKFTVNQLSLSAIYREEERDMIPYCVSTGVSITPWSPLAAGLLGRTAQQEEQSQRQETDQYQKLFYHKDSDDAVIHVVQRIAKERNVTPAQVALAWVLSKQGVSAPVIGATKVHHIVEAVQSLQLKLTVDELNRIEENYKPHEISGHN